MSDNTLHEQVQDVLNHYELSQNQINQQLNNIENKKGGNTLRTGRIELRLETLENVKITKEKALKRNKAMKQIFEVPENLTWLDLSFNQLRSLSPEIAELYNLKILYLHGNQFSDYGSVLPHLRSLPKLYSLTLHGNPIEEKRGYRFRVLSVLPRLRNLDFTNVTNCDLLTKRNQNFTRDTMTS